MLTFVRSGSLPSEMLCRRCSAGDALSTMLYKRRSTVQLTPVSSLKRVSTRLCIIGEKDLPSSIRNLCSSCSEAGIGTLYRAETRQYRVGTLQGLAGISSELENFLDQKPKSLVHGYTTMSITADLQFEKFRH